MRTIALIFTLLLLLISRLHADKDNIGLNATFSIHKYGGTIKFTNPTVKDDYPELDGPLSIGLIAHYPFNGNSNDESRNNFNGVVQGAKLTTDRKGNPNSAYSFDGDDYIDLQTALLPTNGNDWSLSTWVSSNNPNSPNHAVIFGQYSDGSRPVGFDRFHLFELSGFWQYFYGNATIDRLIPFEGLQLNCWKNIVIICKNNTISTYFDGELVSEGVTISTLPNVNSLIGFDGWVEKNRYYFGKIDDIRIYNRALNLDEVKELYNELDNTSDVILGEDNLICDNTSVTLDATSSESATYEWQDGSNFSTFDATETGNYWVTVENKCGIRRDTIYLEFDNTPEVNLGDDKLICDSTSITFDATNFEPVTYEWQDGSNFSTFEATVAGTYWVAVENQCGIRSDTITIAFDNTPEVNLGDDKLICNNTSITFEAKSSESATYEWQDGSNFSTFEATETGNYWVTVENLCGIRRDTISIEFDNIPVVNLGKDRLICDRTLLAIDVPISESVKYEWNDGSTSPTFEATETGIYWVVVENTCGIASDSVKLYSDFIIPNVITPNGDEFNEYFLIDQSIIGSEIQIYQRNGKLVYESLDYQNNWNAKNLHTGVYYYVITLTDECHSNIKGWISVIY